MFSQKNAIKAILLFTGIFLFQMPIEKSICITPQMVFFIFSAGAFFWLCMQRLNKYMAFLFLVAVLMTCKAYLHDFAPRHYLQQDVIFAVAMFGIYYAIRLLKVKQEMLKYLMFPVLVNCAFIFIQKFVVNDWLIFPAGVTGIVSNSGFTACFLALTVPIFFTYFKWGLLPLFYAIFLCDAFVGMIAAIIALFFMVYFSYLRGKKIMAILLVMVLLLSPFALKANNLMRITEADLNQRISGYIGTLDGIRYHFVNGWGPGTFTSMMARIKPGDSRYFKNTSFQYKGLVLSHPHNEPLYWWWSLGLFFMIGVVFLLRDYIKKFSVGNLMPAGILVACFVAMNGYQLKPPSLFILMFSMAIYENSYKGERDNGKKIKGKKGNKKSR